VRVASDANTDERDVWARDLYLDNPSGGSPRAGRIYFDDPAAVGSANRLTANANLLYYASPTDELRDVAVRRAYFADPAAPTTAPTILSSEVAGDRLSLYPNVGTSFPLDVSSLCLRGATAAGTDVAEVTADTGGHGTRNYVDVQDKDVADAGLVRAWGVASSNTPVLVGCIRYNSGTPEWEVDGYGAITPIGYGAYRPAASTISEIIWGGGPYEDAIQVVSADQNFGLLGEFSWHVTAQYDDGSGPEPVHATLVSVGSVSGTNNELTFQFYDMSGNLIRTLGSTSLRHVTFNISVYTKTYTV
jgi:hypothetical protein